MHTSDQIPRRVRHMPAPHPAYGMVDDTHSIQGEYARTAADKTPH
ncbi:hypothetical protein [Xanthomonas citri]|nr:hypothetical protein [Xanthomonas citri]